MGGSAPLVDEGRGKLEVNAENKDVKEGTDWGGGGTRSGRRRKFEARVPSRLRRHPPVTPVRGNPCR